MGQLERDPAGQEPAGQAQLDRDRYSWTGAGTAGQGPAIRTRQVLDRQGFPMCISICSFPSRIDSNKQCFHNQYMHTCLLRATLHAYTLVPAFFFALPWHSTKHAFPSATI